MRSHKSYAYVVCGLVAPIETYGPAEWVVTDGTLIQDLKREARTRDIPVVLLTGYAAPPLRERAQREGCAACFVKPCLPEEPAVGLRHALDRTIVHERVPASR